MSFPIRTLLVLGATALFMATGVGAADLPKRKSGLWEIKTSHDGAGGLTMQICVDEKQDDLTAQQSDKMNKDMRKQCSRMDTRQSGDRIEIDSVCKFDKSTVTGHTVISGKLSTQYTMESTSRFDPPMHGVAQSRTAMTGRWLGPCKPGQKHGAMSISGMPGGAGLDLDPETMKRMQQMQRR